MSEPNSHNSHSLKEIFKALVKTPGIRKSYQRIVAKETWADKMGPLVTSHTRSLSLRKGILTVRVNSDALRHELTYNREKIIQFMNEGFGEELVSEVRITN